MALKLINMKILIWIAQDDFDTFLKGGKVEFWTVFPELYSETVMQLIIDEDKYQQLIEQ